MKLIDYKPLSFTSIILATTIAHLTGTKAADYIAPAPGIPGQIHLNNVNLINGDGTSASTGALLTALDNNPLYGGQVFQLTNQFTATGANDANFSGLDGKVLVPKVLQGSLFSHNVSLLMTKATSPYQFTVTALSSNSLTNGPNTSNSLTLSINGITPVDNTITLTKNDLGLGKVDNTGDADKPISTATQGALNLKANLASPAFTDIPTAPTAVAGTNTAQLATTAFVTRALAAASTHAIGDIYGGGKVFYVNSTGTHGLIATTQDQSIANTWYDAQDVVTVVTNHDIEGQAFTDWRLPTKNELNILYEQRLVVGNLANDYYWASTSSDSSNGAWVQSFSSGYQNIFSKNHAVRVRAIRAF